MNYLLFAGDHYYPKGGAKDLRGRFATIDDAIAAHDPHQYKYDGGWAHIFSLDSQCLVKCFSDGEWRDIDD